MPVLERPRPYVVACRHPVGSSQATVVLKMRVAFRLDSWGNALFNGRRASYWILAVMAVTGIHGCGGGGDGGGGGADTTAPTTPAGVVVTPASPTSVTITWTASTDAGTGVAGYRVMRNNVQVADNIQVTNYVDTGLQPQTVYSYVVLAFDRATPPNVSAPTASVQVTTPPAVDTTPPTVPGNVQAAATGTTTIRVTWTASTDAASGVGGYEVFRDGGAAAVGTVNALVFNDSGLAANSTHAYRVRAFDIASPRNYSALSSSASATTSAVGQSGLDTRPSNTTCVAPARPVVNASAAFARAYPNLTFTQPIAMIRRPADNTTARWYIGEKTGRIRWFVNSANTSTSTLALDISSRVVDPDTGDERGFLGVAFHPNFAQNGRIYVNYITSGPERSRISEFTSTDNGDTFNPASERILLEVNQPADNHNGGNLAFGPDGNLYAGFGDGGAADDFYQNGQRITTVLGKMIRIDPDTRTGGAQYGIPADNPFANNPVCNVTNTSRTTTCPEIWTTGMRNPWRFTFDSQNGELWVGDVMQDRHEEINLIVRGANYGWPIRQGAFCFPTGTTGCPTAGLTDPVAELDRSEGGSAIVAGYVYRGTQTPQMQGRLIFTDAGSGIIGSVYRSGGNFVRELLNTNADYTVAFVSFGEAADGEMYTVSLVNGTIHKLNFSVSGGGGTIPTSVLNTGCVNPAQPTQPSSGLIPYAPVAPFWSDGAAKERWIGLPNGTQINVEADGDWSFPAGTVLVKNFRLNNQLIETRLFMRHPDGVWGGYTYEWNAAQTDATLVNGHQTRVVGTQTWIYPSQTECFQCHTPAAGNSLGLETPQQNSSILYPQTGRTANQLTTLNTIAVLTPPVAADPATLPRYFDPYNASVGTVTERARSYLHSNCSQCHRPGGPTPVNIDFRYTTPLASMNACDVVPNAPLGIPNERIIAPGGAASSVLVARMNRRDQNAMPPLASNVIDAAGVALLTQWIDGLPGC